MKKIAIIIPYFGRLRDDFPFFLQSVKNNPSIDVLFFTDNNFSCECPNVKVFFMTFGEIICLFQRNFDFKIKMSQPYKLCDFRPSYGEVFKQYLEGYDFWGYGDVDVIWGDLRNFLTDEILSKYHRIFGQGHLCFYRNLPEVNAIYRHVDQPTYKQVFTFDYGCAFDEYYGTSRYWDKNMSDLFYQICHYDDVDCMNLEFRSHRRQGDNLLFSYENGKLFRIFLKQDNLVKEETMYVHFQKRKMEVKTNPGELFIMAPNAFLPYQNLRNEANHKQLQPKKTFYVQRYILRYKDFCNKLRKLKACFNHSEFGVPSLPKDVHHYYK